jgi:hypothetical protein
LRGHAVMKAWMLIQLCGITSAITSERRKQLKI